MRNRYRPYLLPFLFESLGPQCSQCGRRFTADEEGRKKKTAHMDWHFKVNRRITEAEKGAQHRSWLVDKTVSRTYLFPTTLYRTRNVLTWNIAGLDQQPRNHRRGPPAAGRGRK